MSVELRPAECPRCQSTRPTIFIRSDDLTDLVCGRCKSRDIPTRLEDTPRVAPIPPVDSRGVSS